VAQTIEPQKTKSIFEVEREARWRVWALFGLLVVVALVCVAPVAVVLGGAVWLLNADGTSTAPGVAPTAGSLLFSIGLVLLAALLLAVAYWHFSHRSARERLIRMMHAQPLDPGDRFHHRLSDIVEEMRVATGSPAVTCLTIPTRALNAFTFSDLKGGACIGVTEGALSRLSREQLQGVVAHEFGHVLSGDYVTVTSACLLFGIYSGVADTLEGGFETDVRVGAASALLYLLVRLAEVASAVTNAAISREREWEADAAAARYTRDPLSLAQALRMMLTDASGGGYIPGGLSALCIRPTVLTSNSLLARAVATHPPVNDRIIRLLNAAHMSWDQFNARMAASQTMAAQQEHATAAPEPALPTAAQDGFAQLVTPPLAAAPAQPPVAQTPAPPPVASAPPAPPPAAAAPAQSPVAQASPPAAAAPPASAAPLVAALPGVGAGGGGTTTRPGVGQAPAGQGAVGRCPRCGAGLERFDYEGADVLICRGCGGRLAGTSAVQRILTRREMRFDDRQLQQAAAVAQSGDDLRRADRARRAAGGGDRIACPRCGRPMMVRLYSYDHAVEVDYCSPCDLFWFDRDELEVLQALVERQQP
jgi:Zn-dependent protease with chaperone function/Zn-finger nucleic acid-binding protein